MANTIGIELVNKGLNLLTYYSNLVTENAEKFKEFSDYIGSAVKY